MSSPEVVIQVWHDGQYKMVGKTLVIPPYPVLGMGETTPQPVCVHECAANQYHGKNDSPAGIDQVALDWLARMGIRYVHVYVRDEPAMGNNGRGVVWIATVRDIARFGIREPSGGRDRRYLARAMWDRVITGPWYALPWIPKHRTIRLGGES